MSDIDYMRWLNLFNFLDFLHSEDYITSKTYNTINNTIMDLRDSVYVCSWEINHEGEYITGCGSSIPVYSSKPKFKYCPFCGGKIEINEDD